MKENHYKLFIKYPSHLEASTSAKEMSFGQKPPISTSKNSSDYFAFDRYADMIDHPIMYSKPNKATLTVNDIEILLSVYSNSPRHKASSIMRHLENVIRSQKNFLGDINSTKKYSIILYLASAKADDAKGFGALEHNTSTVVVLPESLTLKKQNPAMTEVVSHEFFHIVSPLSVHSEDVHYFDYNKPTFSKHLWMYEGVTEYFATLFQVNQGLVEEKAFYDKIMGKINGAATYDDTMSFTEMSENILEQPYASNYINVYEKGALIGMCLDILLREESNGSRGVLSLMKELSSKYGKNKPFKDDALIEELTAMTYSSVGEFLKTHVQGKAPIAYEKFFEKVGLLVSSERVSTNYIQNSGAMIVAGDQEEGTIFFNELVLFNSFWADNGVKPNDDIVAINGEKLTIANANNVLGATFQWQEGDDLEVILNRAGKEIVIKSSFG